MLWVLMLALPFPFIANTAGWMTAELGRQPWLAYGILRTAHGDSPNLAGGTILFTLLGSAGMYLILGLLYILLVFKEVAQGPAGEEGPLAIPVSPDATAPVAVPSLLS